MKLLLSLIILLLLISTINYELGTKFCPFLLVTYTFLLRTESITVSTVLLLYSLFILKPMLSLFSILFTAFMLRANTRRDSLLLCLFYFGFLIKPRNKHETQNAASSIMYTVHTTNAIRPLTPPSATGYYCYCILFILRVTFTFEIDFKSFWIIVS